MEELIVSREKELKVVTFFGSECREIRGELFEKTVECYIQVFNESWGENWTRDRAEKEISASLEYSEHRLPVASLLLEAGEVIGFAWGLIVKGKENLNPEKDMPYELSPDLKEEGAQKVHYWLEMMVCDCFLLFREIGILKSKRSKLVSFMSFPILKISANHCNCLVYWTNTKSGAFFLGIGLEWQPLHFFGKKGNDCLLMVGNIKNSRDFIELSFEKTKECWEEVNKRINKFFCK